MITWEQVLGFTIWLLITKIVYSKIEESIKTQKPHGTTIEKFFQNT